MNAADIQRKMEKFHYWDSRVLQLECNHFADEVLLKYQDDESGDVNYLFNQCYYAKFDHVKNHDKVQSIKNYSVPQLPYFIQDITVEEKIIDMEKFICCKINMIPLFVEICCKEIEVFRQIN